MLNTPVYGYYIGKLDQGHYLQFSNCFTGGAFGQTDMINRIHRPVKDMFYGRR